MNKAKYRIIKDHKTGLIVLHTRLINEHGLLFIHNKYFNNTKQAKRELKLSKQVLDDINQNNKTLRSKNHEV